MKVISPSKSSTAEQGLRDILNSKREADSTLMQIWVLKIFLVKFQQNFQKQTKKYIAIFQIFFQF